METPKVVLARNKHDAIRWCAMAGVTENFVVVDNIRNIEGLRFYPEDVVRVPGYSKRPDIDDIEEVIRRTATLMPKKPKSTPKPCSRCGWQYSEELLELCRQGKMTLDPHPTHRCEP